MIMATAKLLETEKAYNLRDQNVFVIVFDDVNFDINRIELGKILKKEKYEVENIKTVKPPSKIKMKGAKRTKVAKKRAKKFYIKLKEGQKLPDDFKLEIK